MQRAKQALWRIEFRTDLTRAAAPVIPLGFLMEAKWAERARWLGLLFRRTLTPLELDQINTATWPELASLEPFMKDLHSRAWFTEAAADVRSPGLGSDHLAAEFLPTSALQFVAENFAPYEGEFNDATSFNNLYGELYGLRDRLTPVISAPIIPLPKRKAAPALQPLRPPQYGRITEEAA